MKSEALPLGARLLLGASMAAVIAVGIGLALVMARFYPPPASASRPAPPPVHAPAAPPTPPPAPEPPPLRLEPIAPQPAPSHHLARPERAAKPAPGRPSLEAQDRQMRRAYDRALAAGADRLAVDRSQARWRARRERVTGEDQLAELYSRRIAELNEAAARAAKQPPR